MRRLVLLFWTWKSWQRRCNDITHLRSTATLLILYYYHHLVTHQMRLLVLGGTGPTGIAIVEEALRIFREITIVIYARSPEKIPEELAKTQSVIVIKGELDDLDGLDKAMEGVTAVASALGPSTSPTKVPFYPSNTPLANAYGRVIDAMHKHRIRRIILLGTASIPDPEDKFDIQFSTLVNGVAIFARNSYRDVVAIGEMFKSRGADLDWTIARVPLLNNNDSREVRAGYIGDGQTRVSLTRAGFVAFVAQELHSGRSDWIRKRPMISSI